MSTRMRARARTRALLAGWLAPLLTLLVLIGHPRLAEA